MTDTTLLAMHGVTIALLSLGVSTATMYFAWLRHKSAYDFSAGEYVIQVFARQADHPAPALLSEIRININDVHVGILGNQGGVLFELEPETQTYKGHASERPERPKGSEHG